MFAILLRIRVRNGFVALSVVVISGITWIVKEWMQTALSKRRSSSAVRAYSAMWSMRTMRRSKKTFSLWETGTVLRVHHLMQHCRDITWLIAFEPIVMSCWAMRCFLAMIWARCDFYVGRYLSLDIWQVDAHLEG